MPRVLNALSLSILACLSLAPANAVRAGEAPATDWVVGHKSQTRLSAGRGEALSGGGTRLYAFVEIVMAEGWKTYWKSPGESGLPPHVDLARSENLAAAEVLYPVPERITEKGDTIVGYRGAVVFPIALSPKDPAKPIVVAADVDFGMCKDICVPTSAALTLTLEPGLADPPAEVAARALAAVPRPAATAPAEAATRPRLADVTITRPAPPDAVEAVPGKLVLTVTAPGLGSGPADAFIAPPDGLYLPDPALTRREGDRVVFEAELTPDLDFAGLTGKSIGVTLSAPGGATDATFTFR